MRFLDLFAGIGGFRLGMQQAGHECVGYVEIDKYARKSYEAIHDTEGEWTASDIRSVTDDDLGLLRGRGIDIICGGFPCQAFSVAGKRGGFDDTRGTLFFEIARFAKQIKPRLLLLENVKGLLSHDQGNTFGTILHTLDELGYDTEWQVLNSKNFGVPQNRERVFIVGHLRGFGRREVFPIEGISRKIDAVVSPDENSEFFNTTRNGDAFAVTTRTHACYLERHVKKNQATLVKVKFKDNNSNGYTEAIPGDGIRLAHPNSKTARGRVQKQVSPTLTTSCDNGILLDDYRIRKLTSRECWRLQGFPDWAYDKAKEVNSDGQLYKQTGNSVTVNVIYEIAKRLGVDKR